MESREGRDAVTATELHGLTFTTLSGVAMPGVPCGPPMLSTHPPGPSMTARPVCSCPNRLAIVTREPGRILPYSPLACSTASSAARF